MRLCQQKRTSNALSAMTILNVRDRDGKEPEPSKNETNKNPGFTKNRTEHESINCARTQTEPYPVKNRPESEPKCHGSYSVLSLNEIIDTFTRFTVNEAFYFT